MSQDESFRGLMSRWAAGDRQAAKIIVEQYEPHMRRVCQRLNRLQQRQTGSEPDDVFQSVICDLLRTGPGQLFETPEQFLAYVAQAVINKHLKHRRRSQAKRRDTDRLEPQPIEEFEIVDDAMGPPQQAVLCDLWDTIHALSSEREWRIFQLRYLGHTWPAIAAQLGEKPDAVRVPYDRLLRRVYRKLEFDI